MATRRALPPSPVVRSEELRFALVMNGGVSLAVWMGGVAFEINRFARETHPVYRGLLELTRTSARVDVVSGTSAGGINGALLALAQVCDRGLYSLRDVWMERGAFAHMLRDPAHANPPSLLDGDGYYLPALQQAFAALADDPAWRTPVASVPIDLTLTATLLRGDLQRTIDDLGAAIEDAKHRTRFSFVRSPPRAGVPATDAFVTPEQVDVLARAARTTSSFPIAFEPVFWAPSHFAGIGGAKSPVVHPRFLVDGGLVDNKPFDFALDAILRMPSRGNVRRVLAYVAPDPSVSATTDDDDDAKPPMMAEVAGRSVFAIPTSQSISDQLERIREHNRVVLRQRDALVGLARIAELDQRDASVGLASLNVPNRLALLADELFAVYRYRRIHGLVDTFAEWLESDAAEAAVASAGGQSAESPIGRKTLAWLRAALDADHAWTRDRIPRDGGALERALTDNAPQWEWGLYTVEFLVEFMFDLLRRVQRLRYLMPDEFGEVEVRAWPAQFTGGWEALDDLRTWPDPQHAASRQRPDDRVLRDLWRDAFAITADVDAARDKDRNAIRARWKHELVPRLIADVGRRGDDEALATLARATAEGALRFTADDDDRASWNELARRIGEVMKHLADPIDEVVRGRLDRSPSISIAETSYVDELVALATALELDKSAQDVVRAALRFEVIHYAMSHRERVPNVPVELVQISGNSKSPLADETLAVNKLAGMQLAHFGAFYKVSWRANDWMMGRLDAVERLLAVAVNPDRLYRLYAGHSLGANNPPSRYVAKTIADIALAGASDEIRARVAAAIDADALREELAFLDRQGSRVPETLPRCSGLMTLRLHLEIVQTEMPLVARCARDDETAGADSHGVASQLANQVLARNDTRPNAPPPPLTLDDAVTLFRQKRIGTERLGDEVGSDLFTKTVAQTVAVTHAAAAGERGGLSVTLRGLLKAIGVPIALFYWLAGRLTGGSRTSAAIGAAALAVALTSAVIVWLLPEQSRGGNVGKLLDFSWMLLGVCLLAFALRGWLAFLLAAVAAAAPILLYVSGFETHAVVVGAAEVAIGFLAMHFIGRIYGFGIVIVILLIALALFGDADTRGTLKSPVCAADWAWLKDMLAHFQLRPDCAKTEVKATLQLLLAFLLFFTTFAGFVRGSLRRVIARWWRGR